MGARGAGRQCQVVVGGCVGEVADGEIGRAASREIVTIAGAIMDPQAEAKTTVNPRSHARTPPS